MPCKGMLTFHGEGAWNNDVVAESATWESWISADLFFLHQAQASFQKHYFFCSVHFLEGMYVTISGWILATWKNLILEGQ